MTLTSTWWKVKELAGVEDVRLHNLRHGYASPWERTCRFIDAHSPPRRG